MNIQSIVLLMLIIAAAMLALRFMHKNKGACCGECSACRSQCEHRAASESRTA